MGLLVALLHSNPSLTPRPQYFSFSTAVCHAVYLCFSLANSNLFCNSSGFISYHVSQHNICLMSLNCFSYAGRSKWFVHDPVGWSLSYCGFVTILKPNLKMSQYFTIVFLPPGVIQFSFILCNHQITF